MWILESWPRPNTKPEVGPDPWTRPMIPRGRLDPLKVVGSMGVE